MDNEFLYEDVTKTKLTTQHEAQLINYLKATGVKVGLLVNFGEKLEFKRRIF